MSSSNPPTYEFIAIDKAFRAPDMVGHVEGWRVWRCDLKQHYGLPPKLLSITDDTVWMPRRAFEAKCSRHCRDVPEETHSCGLYSALTLAHLMGMVYPKYDVDGGYSYSKAGQVTVLGQVANWGKVIPGSKGWRSQFSYPVRLWVPYEAWKLAKPLADVYGVPVTLGNWLKARADEALTNYTQDPGTVGDFDQNY
jgi:hypothetical protein